MTERPSLRSGVIWSGGASTLVAVLGLVTLVAVGRWQGPAAYAEFAVIWGLFFGVGGVFAGLQQEVTRSCTAGEGAGRSSLAPVTLVLGLVVGLTGAGLLFRVGGSDTSPTASAAVAAGLLGMSGMTFLSGVLAARSDWPRLAIVLVLDAGTRTTAVVLLAATGRGSLLPVGIASGTVAWLLLLASPIYRRAFSARGHTDVLGFLRRAVIAMGSTGCAALLVAGLPLIVATFRSAPLDAGAGSVLAALILIRSALLVPLYGYRPVILRGFLRSGQVHVALWRAWGWCVWIGGGWTLATAVLGPAVLKLVLGQSFSVTRAECAALAVGALGTMLLVVSGLALVAKDQHLGSGAGWLLALVVSVLLVPLPDDPRSSVTLAALVGPWAGVAVHAWLLSRPTAMSFPAWTRSGT